MQLARTRINPDMSAPSADVEHFEEKAGSLPAPIEMPRESHALGPLQSGMGLAILMAWLVLFGSGIIVDTAPHRSAISPEGARLLRAEGQPAGEATTDDKRDSAGRGTQDASNSSQEGASQPAISGRAVSTGPLWWSWLVVLTCFLPLNLAWLCVTSSTLGAIGNLANLGDDGQKRSPPDTSNPLTSAVLRGFFVYLFLMSGLLLLDHAPFSNAGPSQYIRLAGFLSLFSFVVSYHPQLFAALIVSAFERIQVRARDGGKRDESERTTSVVQQEKTTIVEHETTSATRSPTPVDAVAPPDGR